MKRTIYSLLLSALPALFALTGCQQEEQILVQIPAINVSTQRLNPDTNESGTVRAYEGTQVTAFGFNLDKVGLVTVNDIEAPVVSAEIKKLVFEIPVLGLPQQDDPYRTSLMVYAADKKTVAFRYDYYVTVPVTDALVTGITPLTGTVGTQLSISGRNLEQITKVVFNGVEVTSFVSQAADLVKVKVPAIETSTAHTDVSISAVWGTNTIDLTADAKFDLLVPVFESYSQGEAVAALGDEVVLAGENLDLVSSVLWGETSMIIAAQSATSVTIKVPSSIEQADPVVVSKALTAVYGDPAQSVEIASAFKVNTTPLGPAAPTVSSVSPADNSYSNIYLAKEVVVTGENLASIESFKIDGVTAAVKGTPTDIEARFTVPSTISGYAAKEVDLVAVWGGGNEADFGKVTVYPFYYTKGLRIRIGSNSKNTYPVDNAAEAFLLLDEGRVVSTQDWYDTPVDPFAKSGANTVVTANNMVTGSEEDYYSVKPYVFCITNSSHKLSWVSPSNSNSQLKTHCLIDGDTRTSLPATWGTPGVFFAVETKAVKDLVAAGTLTDIKSEVTKPGKAAPAFGNANDWVTGTVLTLQYADYTHVSSKPGESFAGAFKTGFIYIRDVTCGDASTSLANTDRAGYIEFDLYWSNQLVNE